MADALEQVQNTDAVAGKDAAPRTWQFSKTKMCKFELIGMCTKGEQCPFAHDKDELRPLPDLTCTKLCTTLIKTGLCNRKSCTYAHTKDELRATSTFHKTKLCRFSQTGHCALGGKCNFAHSPSEIRQVDTASLDGAQSDQPFDEPPTVHLPFQQSCLPMPAIPPMLSMAAEVLPRQQGSRRAKMRAAGNRRSVHVSQAEGAGAAARGQDASSYALEGPGQRTGSKTSPAYVTQMTTDFVVTNTFLERGHVDDRMPPRRSAAGWAGASSSRVSEEERQYAVGFAPRAAGAITGGESASSSGRAGPAASAASGEPRLGAAADRHYFDGAGTASGTGNWQFVADCNEGPNTYSGSSGASSSYALPPGAGFLPNTTDPGMSFLPNNMDPGMSFLPNTTGPGASFLPSSTDPGASFLPSSTNPGAMAEGLGLDAAAGSGAPALTGFGHSPASWGGPPTLAGSFVVDQTDDGWHVKNTFLNFSSPPKPIRSVRTAEGALCTLGGEEEE